MEKKRDIIKYTHSKDHVYYFHIVFLFFFLIFHFVFMMFFLVFSLFEKEIDLAVTLYLLFGVTL